MRYANEREVEVPWVVERCFGKVLDVGKDRVGYTSDLVQRGCQVVSCDPEPGMMADHMLPFQDLIISGTFDVILFLSSLEHFDASPENLERADTDVYCICKCRELLKDVAGGVIIISVPYGREHLYTGAFIQWSYDRVRRVQFYSSARAIEEQVAVWTGTRWRAHPVAPLDDVKYRADAGAAASVYMGLWKL